MPFTIVRQDITKMKVDAIVNAANTALAMGGGVCGAIFKAAGSAKMQKACNKVSPINTGYAAITPGFNLPSRYVIHAAGPVYGQWSTEQNKQLLYSAYKESLKLAVKYKCKSIAFPLISSGTYGYPKDKALQVASGAIKEFLMDYDMDVYLVIFDRAAFLLSQELVGAVESYIDENYVDAHHIKRQELSDVSCTFINSGKSSCFDNSIILPKDLDEWVEKLDEPFHAALLRIIDDRGKTDAEVYKRANIDRKLFSKIRSGKGYMPGKRTILALAIALELSLDETERLLKKAGYALSHSQKFDVIVEFFIVRGKYDIFEINQVLFQYDQPLLGMG